MDGGVGHNQKTGIATVSAHPFRAPSSPLTSQATAPQLIFRPHLRPEGSEACGSGMRAAVPSHHQPRPALRPPQLCGGKAPPRDMGALGRSCFLPCPQKINWMGSRRREPQRALPVGSCRSRCSCQEEWLRTGSKPLGGPWGLVTTHAHSCGAETRCLSIPIMSKWDPRRPRTPTQGLVSPPRASESRKPEERHLRVLPELQAVEESRDHEKQKTSSGKGSRTA